MVRFTTLRLKRMIRLFEDKLHAEAYAQHRPTWPNEVAKTAIKYLNHKKNVEVTCESQQHHSTCSHLVDVGCGSGQSTLLYAPFCKKITALDPSEEQIKSALQNNQFDHINFVVGSGENIPLPSNSVELICCAQSIHWMDWNAYFKECRRVLVDHGCMVTYGYTLPKIIFADQHQTEKTNDIFQSFYKECHFHPRRRHVDNCLKEFYEALPCVEKKRDDSLKITRIWTMDELQGYISTWSGYRKLAEEISSDHLLPQLIKDIKHIVGAHNKENQDVSAEIVWNIFMILSTRPTLSD